QEDRAQSTSARYVPSELALCLQDVSETMAVRYHIMERLLLRIASFVEQRHIPLVFVLAPSFFQVDEQLWTSALARFGLPAAECSASLLNEKLVAFAQRAHLRMLDLLPMLRAAATKGTRLYHPREQHWTREANHLVAAALIRYLTMEGLTRSLNNASFRD